jgi:Protein of unknown function (DUF559)
MAALAERQHGVIHRRQLELIGVSGSTISRWVGDGFLHRLHPCVYAVGHTALSAEGRIRAALLYVGAGSALSHSTAAWWWRLIEDLPFVIHAVAPGDRASVPGVAVHHPRRFETTVHRGLPVTTVPQTLLNLAAAGSPSKVRRLLAETEFRRLAQVEDVAAMLGRGRHGSATLRRAIATHRPELARTRSVLEERFLALCEGHGIPAPEVNVEVCGYLVDALWRDRRVIVELDGHAAHGTAAAFERDRARDLALRAAGYLVLRYTWRQVTREAAAVARDLRGSLSLELSAVAPRVRA